MLSTLIFSTLEPSLAWRVLFAIGLVPTLLVLWIRRKEASAFTQACLARPDDTPRV
ncbi:hypothetical protein [Paraburkholderia sp. 32]|uniref:hypothetical protein n=1 Tax=Paraburkholderia sp. 32 TaxID=2991057 RepID=UPI003D1BDFB6